MSDHTYFSNLIWQIADLLRGPYRPPQYERVMLPMTVLRRFDCVLAPTKAKVLTEHQRRKGTKIEGDALDTHLNKAAGQRFHNHSPLDFERLKGDPDNIEKHLVSYIKGFSKNVRDIFDFFEFEAEVERMREANILYLVVSKFCDVDLHPNTVPNEQMGLIFENLIRRFNELANETAGDHFTPREVIRLMVNILFIHDDKLLATPGTVRKLLDPACGTGGMLAEAQNYLREHHGAAKLYVYGQDYNKRAFATAASDMLMKQVDHNGLDPLSWTPHREYWRSSQWQTRRFGMRRSFGARWWSWCGPGVARRRWQRSSGHRVGRFRCGSSKPLVMVARATAG